MEERARPQQLRVHLLQRLLMSALALIISSLWIISAVSHAAQDQSDQKDERDLRVQGDQSYQALRYWIDQYQPDAQTVTPGQHLTQKDRKNVLEALIPHSAWEYYFFDGMDMEIAPTGHYPPQHLGERIETVRPKR